MHDDHDHDHTYEHGQGTELSPLEIRVRALETRATPHGQPIVLERRP